MASWGDLRAELHAWAEAGQPATLWWRDDDATKTGPRLARLLALARDAKVPLALAVIPGQVQDDLVAAVAEMANLSLLVHGLHHRNLASEGEKKAEFGPHRPVHEMLGDAAIAYEALLARFPEQARPIFVPPWNRMDERLAARLPLARLTGLSRYGPRTTAAAAPDLVECNCHVDLVNWRGDRGFVGRGAALDGLIGHLAARRGGTVDASEATGILTHHDVMDEEAWKFLAELFDRTTECDGAHWLCADEIFRLPV